MNLKLFKTPISAIIAGLVLLVVSVVGLAAAEARLGDVMNERFNSYLLADELRQSSDDLTRLGRTYVATGNPQWEGQYFEILDIRNGKKARPNHYERIYWDFRAADITPQTGTGPTVSLAVLMKKAGFSDAEFAKLREAENNSNDLVQTETAAMNMVKGLYPDADGKYTVQDTPNQAKALNMLHNKQYHQYKAKIMAPVNEFLTLLDERTASQIEDAESNQSLWSYAIALTTFLVAVSTAWAMMQWWWINNRLGGHPDEVVKMVGELANGNFVGSQNLYPVPDNSVLAGLISMREKVSSVFGTVRNNAEGVASALTQIAAGTQDLAHRTEQQSSGLQTTALTMEQLSSNVGSNADNSQKANELARGAADIAQRGGKMVADVVETMDSISESSNKITEIIGVIDGIAFQTNILALNSAVEAARAGEQGRGFAVVAGEVRSLAKRSADAADEIKKLITISNDRVAQGSQVVNDTGRTMKEIVNSIQELGELVAQISTASTEQSNGVRIVKDSVMEIDVNTQQNAALVEESTAATQVLRDRADDLVQAVSVFRLA